MAEKKISAAELCKVLLQDEKAAEKAAAKLAKDTESKSAKELAAEVERRLINSANRRRLAW